MLRSSRGWEGNLDERTTVGWIDIFFKKKKPHFKVVGDHHDAIKMVNAGNSSKVVAVPRVVFKIGLND